MADKKHLIWGNINLDLDEWRDSLQENYPGISEDRMYEIMTHENDSNFQYEQDNLNIQLPREIIVIADIGRWDGRYQGYQMIDSGNIKDCLAFEQSCDYAEWYVDKQGDLRSSQHHHDGTHHLLYRAISPHASDEQVERLQSKIYNRTATRADITRLTERLGDHIGHVYGWQFPRPSKSIQEQIAEYKSSTAMRSNPTPALAAVQEAR